MVKTEIAELIKKYIDALITENINVEKVLLFGSYATDKAHEWSDIDIAIISPDFGKDRFEERVSLAMIANRVDPRIEPHPIGSDEFEQEAWKTMIHEIKTNGIEIAA
jgi:predicted nucleotidyltransferase